MIHALYHRHPFQHFRRTAPKHLLESAVAKGLIDGELTAGDPIAAPDELGRRLGISPSEVLESVSQLLAQRILDQDSEGNLFIHSAAIPGAQSSAQAFALRARQLRDSARACEQSGATIKLLLRASEVQVA